MALPFQAHTAARWAGATGAPSSSLHALRRANCHNSNPMDVQRTISEAIETGTRLEFYACPDACLVCRALLGKVFEPHDAPMIPVPNCTNQLCRCDYLPALRDRPRRFSPE